MNHVIVVSPNLVICAVYVIVMVVVMVAATVVVMLICDVTVFVVVFYAVAADVMVMVTVGVSRGGSRVSASFKQRSCLLHRPFKLLQIIKKNTPFNKTLN